MSVFKAITPDDIGSIDHSYDEAKARCFTGRPLMLTEIACALSHITLGRELLDDNEVDHYLILEDDIEIKQNIAVILNNKSLFNVGLLKLSGQHKRPMKKISNINNKLSLYKYAYGPLDAACYLINKESAKKLIEHCKTVHTPIDILMDRSYDHKVDVYGVFPYPVHTEMCYDKENPLITSIGNRDKKYADDIKVYEKILVRFQRWTGSIKKLISTLKLFVL